MSLVTIQSNYLCLELQCCYLQGLLLLLYPYKYNAAKNIRYSSIWGTIQQEKPWNLN